MRNPLAISTMAVLLAAIVSPGRTEERQSSVTVYTAPEINLGEIDREIIDQVGAGGYINLAAFVLSDYAIIDALRSAALRGARIRLYLDPEELTRLRLSEDHPLVKLVHTQGVDTRVKASGEGLMHLKAYSVSGALLRTGSANESVSGLEHQDNDLEIITDRAGQHPRRCGRHRQPGRKVRSAVSGPHGPRGSVVIVPLAGNRRCS